jgi:hypothetical protein
MRVRAGTGVRAGMVEATVKEEMGMRGTCLLPPWNLFCFVSLFLIMSLSFSRGALYVFSSILTFTRI